MGKGEAKKPSKRGKARIGRGRGRGQGPDRPGSVPMDLAGAKSTSASEPCKVAASAASSNSSDIELGASVAATSSAGKNHVRNSRQKETLRGKCARAVARADSLAESLKHVLEENSVLRTEKAQAEGYISSLKEELALSQEYFVSLRKDNDSLRAALAVRNSSAAQEPAGDSAALGATVQDLDKCIESMDS